MSRESRYMSLVLRHKPEDANLILNEYGYASVKFLLVAINKKYPNSDYTLDKLLNEVSINDKRRFLLTKDNKFIKASQGHSINIKLEVKEQIPPHILFHGTVSKNMSLIRQSGIKKMNRHHVHLSEDINTAINVGSRRGDPIIIHIDAKQMSKDNIKFYKTENGVWLTDIVDFKYFLDITHE